MNPVMIPADIRSPQQKIFYADRLWELDEAVNEFIESYCYFCKHKQTRRVSLYHYNYLWNPYRKIKIMNKYTVTIQSAHYGTWNYSGQPEEYLTQDEERSTIQILRLILNHLIFYKLKLNGNFYDTIENKTQLIKEIYQTIKKENYFEISYWNPTNWSETTIGIEKN